MSIITIAVIVFCAWIVVMAAAWCARWGNALSVVFVVGVTALAVGVSWQRIEQHRADQAAVAAFHHRTAAVMAVAAPPPAHPHSVYSAGRS